MTARHPTPSPLDALYSAWKRLGIALTAASARDPVDLEQLIVDTAAHLRDDARLAICVAAWLARYHDFVDGRRLSERARALRTQHSACLGVLLTLAMEAPGGAQHAPQFDATLSHCRPLRTPIPLYSAAATLPRYRQWLRQHALPLYLRWGFWHDELELKFESIHTIDALLRVPELRTRALLGPSLESACLALVPQCTTTAQTLSRQLGVTYAATHAAVERLVGRGLLSRRRSGVRQELALTPFSRHALGLN